MIQKGLEWLLDRARSVSNPCLRVLLFLGIIAGAGWLFWDDFTKIPGVLYVVDAIRYNHPLPVADKTKLSIGVVHLNEDDDTVRQIIIEDLSDVQGVQVAAIERVIETTNIDDARNRARAILDASHFDVLVWGTVLRDGSKSVPKLYWTTVSNRFYNQQAKTQQAFDDSLQLPPAVLSTLSKILSLVVTTSVAELIDTTSGHFTDDKLKALIVQTRPLIDNATEIDYEGRAGLSLSLGAALAILGEKSGSSGALQESVQRYRDALSFLHGSIGDRMWVAAQNGLGNALLVLGNQEVTLPHLVEASKAFDAALHGHHDALSPIEWTRVERNHCTSIAIIGERDAATDRLKQALTCYQKPLKQTPEHEYPLEWATTLADIGATRLSIGQREIGLSSIVAAIAAINDALREQTRERVPIVWAEDESRIATAYAIIGGRKTATNKSEAMDAFQRSSEAFSKAFLEETEDREPLLWANTKYQAGFALVTLADQGHVQQFIDQTTPLGRAIEAFNSALKVFTHQQNPIMWARTEHSLGHALNSLGQRSHDPRLLHQAVAAYTGAVAIETATSLPFEYALCEDGVGNTYRALGELYPKSSYLVQSLRAHSSALSHLTREHTPKEWAQTQNNLGATLYDLGQQGKGVVYIQRAIAAFASSESVYLRAGSPELLKMSRDNLAQARRLLLHRHS